MKQYNFKIIFIILLVSTSCKKEICNEKINEVKVEVNAADIESVILEHSKDIVNISFDGVLYEGRCDDWFNNPLNTCNTLCGDASIVGYIEINYDTLFYFNYYMDGCRLEQISPKIDLRYNGIEILFERLDPYPEDYNNIILEDYVATFKIFQTVEICEKK